MTTTTTTTTNSFSNSTPWVEKYRPKTLSEVSHQTEVVSTLQNAVQTNRLPHLLLYGPPGTGKTSVALALCKTLWSPDQLHKRVLELNASDERGISVVRDKIKHFASLAVGRGGGGGGVHSNSNQALTKKKRKNFFQKQSAANDNEDNNNHVDDTNDDDEDTEMKDATSHAENQEEKKEQSQQLQSYPNPPFKIIILDEADTVTPDAQAALRRIIEAHSKITRFILICNYVTRIIEPLASRCAKFRFQSLPPQSMMHRLQSISKAEHVRFVPHPNLVSEEERKEKEVDVLNEILNLCQGDMRRAVTTLQSAHLLSGGSIHSNTSTDDESGISTSTNEGYIQKESIAEMAGLPPQSIIDSLLETLQKSTSTYATMEQNVNDIILEGYAAKHIMKELFKKVIVMDSKVLSEMDKANIAIKIAEAEKNLVDSADETLQLLVVCSLILKCFH